MMNIVGSRSGQGTCVGVTDGSAVGSIEGSDVGLGVGFEVGSVVGCGDGLTVGPSIGSSDSCDGGEVAVSSVGGSGVGAGFGSEVCMGAGVFGAGIREGEVVVIGGEHSGWFIFFDFLQRSFLEPFLS